MTIQLDRGDLWGLAAATTAALDTGLLAALAEGRARPAADLAGALGLDAAGVARVLDVLVAAGVVVREDGAYAFAPDLLAAHAAFPGGLGLTTALFAGTPDYVRTGRTAWAMDGSRAERATAYQSTVGGLARLFEEAARAFAAALPVTPPARVLDVGCGSGVWSLAVAERHPAARVVGVDLPGVLDVFLATAASRGLADRVDALPGDMHEVDLPDADLVVLANVLRLEPAPRAEALILRLARAVRPGGALVVIDALAGGTPEREVARAVYALHLALRTREAEVHPPERVAGFLADAGLADVRTLDFGVHPGAVAAIVGRRR